MFFFRKKPEKPASKPIDPKTAKALAKKAARKAEEEREEELMMYEEEEGEN